MTPTITQLTENKYLKFLAILLATFLLYMKGLNVGYFNDDFAFLFANPKADVLAYIFEPNGANSFYRPLQVLFLGFVQVFWGENTIAIHLVHILLHSTLIYLIYLIADYLGFSKIQKIIALLFLLVSQANVHAVVSNDTSSMLGSTVSGFLCLYSLTNFFDKNRLLFLLISYVCFIMALFFKESGVAFYVLIGILLFIKSKNNIHFGNIKFLLVFSIFTALLVFYLYIRNRMGGLEPSISSNNNYGFNFGFNIIINYFQLIGSTVFPISSAHFFKWFALRNISQLVLCSLLLIPYFCILFFGFARQLKGSNGLRGLTIFFLLSFLPVVFLNHISELYAYNAMPFVALIIGFVLGNIILNTRSKLYKIGIISFLILIGFVNIFSVQAKVSLMKQNGIVAGEIVSQLADKLNLLPENSQVFLVNQQKLVRYSVFFQHEFHLIEQGLNILPQITGRPDLKIQMINSSEIQAFSPLVHSYFFGISPENQKVEQIDI